MIESRLQESFWRSIGFALLAGVVASSECQSLCTSRPLHLNEDVSLEMRPVESASTSYVRQIFDQSSGDRWILQRDETGSPGPGRMVLMTSPARPMDSGGRERASSHKRREGNSTALVPIIHTGERLIVEEYTAKIEAWLEGVALGQATTGAVLAVRLKMGGRTVMAIAQAPGRAVILLGIESHR